MAKKTINQALRDLFIGLGGNASDLADNTSVSDYIADLESAIKAYASGSSEDLIDDTEASENKTYSSSKIESLSGSTYSETTLFEGFLQNTDIGTLSDSIANYDALIFVSTIADPDSGDRLEIKYPYIPTSDLIGNYYDIKFGSVNPVFAFKFATGTSITWLCDTVVVKIIGVKF